MKTKLRHFAQRTSPQFTALSRGKHLPLSTSDSPPPSPSASSPLTVSISLAELKLHHTAQSSIGSAHSVPSSMQKKRGRSSNNKNKVRPTALSSFVMKKRACSPSAISDSGSPCPPPPAKRLRMDSESDVSLNGEKSGGEAGSRPFSCDPLRHSQLSDRMSTEDTCGRTSTPFHGTSQRPEFVAIEKNRGSCVLYQPKIRVDDSVVAGISGDDDMGGSMGSLCVPEDDQLSVTSASTTSTVTTANHTSQLATTTTKNRKEKSQTPAVANTSGITKRGRPTKNNGTSLGSELQSLMSTSKSSINFNQMFSFYPPNLVVRNGELVPDRSLSVKRIDRSTVGSLPENHPFLSWNLGQPAKGSVTLRGKKRKAPKAVRIT